MAVYVSAVVTAREGRGEELGRELAAVVAEVRREAGCLRYDLHRADDGVRFLFYEIWESPAHLEAHARSAHLAAMRAATADLVAGPSDVVLWEALDVAK
ncbi:putative quinol monooxygenase [Pseudodesulfovibrio sp.]|uniref:putative quinol monooxygenase n=1 Tax=Pseudodesulfovibrio sp. TaxID=2035812 RepID=UPI00261781E1|nr:putative quinol monooxygenase [Pseudodesulfovibrio sp.]MDD3312894.1 putative quinol monooxygenase [Pseudodesulfovibrio sp.]